MKEKKKFDVVKHVKRLSRAASKAPGARVVPSKRQALLRRIAEKEARESK